MNAPVSLAPFPALSIHPDRFEAQGSFAEAQKAFLDPDPAEVSRLGVALRASNAGVVAHFYMDPELQGVLTRSDWPFIHISDSLMMADRAIEMAQAGAKVIIVLGVDFMSENVRAMLDASGFAHVPVYRVAAAPIGCSLAESAEAPAYAAYLRRASQTPRSLHVVYINTSLITKASAHAVVPTITCTSSNVIKTVLTAFAQVPEAHVWFGPDTYMGQNLETLFGSLPDLPDEVIAKLHPDHTRESIRALLPRFHYFQQGTCVVHHLFGAEVAERVRTEYQGAFVTAHLEVPGEMFAVALDAQRQGRGVVGSTSDILGFIAARVEHQVAKREGTTLRFVLGTEAGMVTSIVERVRTTLSRARDAGGPEIVVQIVFPVASDAVAASPNAELGIVPGVAAGEGCSTAGGCATCPYMKMNSLDALLALLDRLPAPAGSLTPFEPRKYLEPVAGRTAAELGGEPILHMRALQQSGRLPPLLVDQVLGTARVRADTP